MHESTSDIALLRAWQRHGDAEAFHTIVQRHAGLVYNTCRRVVRNDEDAADVSQECFLSLATAPPEIQKSLAGWLHRLATHRALDHLKSANRRRVREARYEGESQRGAEAPSGELLEWVDEAIDQLPDDLRLPLVEHFLHQKSHQEVADSMGLPRRTVSRRISRAVDRIRDKLRARGAMVSGVALLAFLEARATEAVPVPEALLSALGKQAVAGNVAAHGGMAAVTGSGAFKVASLSAVMVALIGAGWWWIAEGDQFASGRVGGTPTPSSSPIETGGFSPSVATTDSEADVDSPVTPPAGSMLTESAVVAGRVYDKSTDSGIAGVTVKLITGRLLQETITDSFGAYRMDNLPEGTAQIRIGRVSGYNSQENPQQVQLRSASASLVDFSMEPGEFSGIHGIVVNGSGEPVAGALVTAWSTAYPHGTDQKRDVRSEADGTFAIDGLKIDPRVFLKASTNSEACAPLGPMRLGQDGLADQRLVLYPVATLGGTVADSEGHALGTAYRVRAQLRNAAGESIHVNLSEDSAFSVDNLAPGTYDLFVEHTTRRTYFVRDMPEATIDLAAGDVRTDIALETRLPQTFARIDAQNAGQRPEPPEHWGTIRGTIRDAGNGRPVENLRVEARVYGGASSSGRTVDIDEVKATYQLEATEADYYVLEATAPGYAPNTIILRALDLTPPTTVAGIEMTPGAVVNGRVANHAGEPIAGAAVYGNLSSLELIRPVEETPGAVRTDAEGLFQLRDLPETPIRVYVVHPTYAYGWADLTPSRSAPQLSVITLNKGGTITGTLTRGDAVVSNHPVSAYQPDAREFGYFYATTDDTGAFQMTCLVPGTYSVYAGFNLAGAGGPADRKLIQDVLVSENTTTDASAMLAEGTARLAGMVTLNGTQARGPVGVSIVGTTAASASTHIVLDCQEGQYQGNNLPEGPVEISVMIVDEAGARYTRRVPAVLAPGRELTLDVHVSGLPVLFKTSGLPAGGTLNIEIYEGHVPMRSGATEAPPAYQNAQIASTVTSENGDLSLSAIPEGHHTMIARLHEGPGKYRQQVATIVQFFDVSAERENTVELNFH